MKKLIVIVCVVIGVIVLNSFTGKNNTMQYHIVSSDSLEKDRAKYTALVLAKIRGREKLPSDSVYKNIRMLKGMPANRLLAIMNVAYSKSLGVSCGHCHNTDDFSSEEKKQKEITRQMAAMNKEINTGLLKNIQNLQTSPAVINCTTCHRGEIKPALDID